MKKLALAIILCGIPSIYASTITKVDIIATVEHQRRLVHEAQADAATAKAELGVVQEAINEQTAKLHETETQLSVTKKELSDEKNHFNKLLLLCSSLVGLIVFAGIQRFSSVLLSFYPPALAADWFISIGSGAVAGIVAWQFLAHL